MRGLGLERPLMVLSGNSLEFARIMLAATLVGVPVAPISPAYSLVSKTFEKLRYIHDLINPGLIYVEDTRSFTGALNTLGLEDTEVVTAHDNDGQVGASSFAELLTVPVDARVQEAVAQVRPETVAKILFTSGSTGMPKGVINTHRMLSHCATAQRTSARFSVYVVSPYGTTGTKF
jgi:feruloyl-CoA synthase